MSPAHADGTHGVPGHPGSSYGGPPAYPAPRPYPPPRTSAHASYRTAPARSGLPAGCGVAAMIYLGLVAAVLLLGFMSIILR